MRGQISSSLAQLARALPLLPLEMLAGRLIDNVMATRPVLAARLADYAGHTFLIDPVDCPFVFFITPFASHVRVRVAADARRTKVDARIAAPLIVLLGMADGTYDGDALFFSRDLMIEGDTEAVLALRNAIENAELALSDIIGLPESLHAPFDSLARLAADHLRRALGAPEPSGLGRSVAPR